MFVGLKECASDGSADGTAVAEPLGFIEGSVDGCIEEIKVGSADSTLLGPKDGTCDGNIDDAPTSLEGAIGGLFFKRVGASDGISSGSV
jgi:hypothetical protein